MWESIQCQCDYYVCYKRKGILCPVAANIDVIEISDIRYRQEIMNSLCLFSEMLPEDGPNASTLMSRSHSDKSASLVFVQL